MENNLEVYLVRYLGKSSLEVLFYPVTLLCPSPYTNAGNDNEDKAKFYNLDSNLPNNFKSDMFPKNLIRHKATKTLVRLNTQQRAGQIKDAFSLIDTSVFTGKHLLLVDDVVTTGTTLSEAANCLLQIEDAQVSVATIAFAKSPLP